jgi:hypothetical protein
MISAKNKLSKRTRRTTNCAFIGMRFLIDPVNNLNPAHSLSLGNMYVIVLKRGNASPMNSLFMMINRCILSINLLLHVKKERFIGV